MDDRYVDFGMMGQDIARSETPAFHSGLARRLVTRHVEGIPKSDEPLTFIMNETTTNLMPTFTAEALDAVGELLKLFVEEAQSRATMEAELEQEATLQEGESIQVRAEHFAKVAAAMIMDFS